MYNDLCLGLQAKLKQQQLLAEAIRERLARRAGGGESPLHAVVARLRRVLGAPGARATPSVAPSHDTVRTPKTLGGTGDGSGRAAA